MREMLEDGIADLIYLDPPFNSKRTYNTYLGGAQQVAFDDTWQWHEAVNDFHEVAKDTTLANTMEGLRKVLGEGPELAYLSYMANRIRECKRVLADKGSVYLHCDPTMSHYIKVVMDGIFGKGNFQNEIVWSYRTGGASKKRFARKHDIILFYSKSSAFNFNVLKEKAYTKSQNRRPGRVNYGGGTAEFFEDERGVYNLVNMRDVWEISYIGSTSPERLKYPTQKPLELLKRILAASSQESDVILDPFCGCGTTIHAAQVLQRHWLGIDVSATACDTIRRRLSQNLNIEDVNFEGLPKTIDDAKRLAEVDKFRFERWAASLVDGLSANKKQRGDKGIDGWGRIPLRRGEFIDIVSQVKGGGTGPGDIQAFSGAISEFDADMGIFTCFSDRVTTGMRNAAASTGQFMDAPKVQIYTVEDFFSGKEPKLPRAA